VSSEHCDKACRVYSKSLAIWIRDTWQSYHYTHRTLHKEQWLSIVITFVLRYDTQHSFLATMLTTSYSGKECLPQIPCFLSVMVQCFTSNDYYYSTVGHPWRKGSPHMDEVTWFFEMLPAQSLNCYLRHILQRKATVIKAASLFQPPPFFVFWMYHVILSLFSNFVNSNKNVNKTFSCLT
jgi:hypothetical protein